MAKKRTEKERVFRKVIEIAKAFKMITKKKIAPRGGKAKSYKTL